MGRIAEDNKLKPCGLRSSDADAESVTVSSELVGLWRAHSSRQTGVHAWPNDQEYSSVGGGILRERKIRHNATTWPRFHAFIFHLYSSDRAIH